MSAGCARCGSCCDPVHFERERLEAILKWTTEALEGVPDPGTDEGWEHWLKHGYAASDRERAVCRFDPAGRYRTDVDFIAAHWAPIDDKTVACDAYDPETALCTAHENRPPVCRDYPWYGREPSEDTRTDLDPHCSYLADLPPDKRPEGSRPLIPLTVVTRTAA